MRLHFPYTEPQSHGQPSEQEGVFTCKLCHITWQETQCDHTWQVTSSSSEMEFR